MRFPVHCDVTCKKSVHVKTEIQVLFEDFSIININRSKNKVLNVTNVKTITL